MEEPAAHFNSAPSGVFGARRAGRRRIFCLAGMAAHLAGGTRLAKDSLRKHRQHGLGTGTAPAGIEAFSNAGRGHFWRCGSPSGRPGIRVFRSGPPATAAPMPSQAKLPERLSMRDLPGFGGVLMRGVAMAFRPLRAARASAQDEPDSDIYRIGCNLCLDWSKSRSWQVRKKCMNDMDLLTHGRSKRATSRNAKLYLFRR